MTSDFPLPPSILIFYFHRVKQLLLLLLTGSIAMKGQSQYWQQNVDYRIAVQLDAKAKTLDGVETITYTNHSPDTLRFIWFHLWPNSYKNDKTAFSEQLLLNGNTAFYFSDKEQRGYINRLDFKVDGVTARMEDHPQHIDIIKVVLPRPLLPGAKAQITTPFHVKLPFNFSRGGFDGHSFQITQWYPKPAVYDAKGWHPMPYLDQGEFYSEFGRFDVSITVPENFVVAASGELQTEEEKAFLQTRIPPSVPQQKMVPARKPAPTKPTISTKTKTLHYIQDRVHDFAWFANPDFVVAQDTCRLPSGRVISVQSFYTPQEVVYWNKSLQYAKDAVRFYSAEVGDYPYNTLTVVQGPQSFGGGMEYPTITVISPVNDAKALDEVIAHEIGHNWFYGIMASNEREHPWMDEGINSFYEKKYIIQKYGLQRKEEEILFQTLAARKRDQPIETTSEAFSQWNYGAVAYHKTAEWLRSLDLQHGAERFRQAMQAYYQRWQFKHPQPQDFQQVYDSVLGVANWQALTQKGVLPHNAPKGFQVITPFRKGALDKYLKSPAKNVLLFTPAIGYNSYDKLMAGGLVTNYKLPPNKFHYLFIPMYATGSKQLTGLGRLNYTVTSGGWIRKADFFVNGARFTMNDFRDTADRKLTMQFGKLVPGFRLTLREKDPRSTVNRYVQWKTFFINEENLRIRPDTVITGTDTAAVLRYATPTQNRYLNQLQLVYENYRALYPFRLEMQVEQAQDFVRPAFTANYFFNYAKGGGLQLRFFAGGFFYLGDRTLSKRFANDRYHLNMSGPNGYEDYTYSDYFVGRNRFEGLASQQMMMRDGGFKVRTELLADKVGKTDEWLMALNLSTSIPDKLNPLSVLPIKIPLRVFFDIGTQAGGWARNSEEDRFLYDAGLHLPLFDETVNVYIPLLYSSVFGDYFKSTIPENRFLKTISFTINFNNKAFRTLNRIAEF